MRAAFDGCIAVVQLVFAEFTEGRGQVGFGFCDFLRLFIIMLLNDGLDRFGTSMRRFFAHQRCHNAEAISRRVPDWGHGGWAYITFD